MNKTVKKRRHRQQRRKRILAWERPLLVLHKFGFVICYAGCLLSFSRLLSVTVVIAFCAEYLIESIEETAVRHSISKAFIGVVSLPITCNAAEHIISV
ncbi:hypothetical protein F4604DRAFT_1738374 [Suillus subluteus]|nr:hypothetical protein F4604DRAFT_1738374 [Suillus subluteus]